ncbi:MAG: hypothetical protein QMD71_04155 [bacterium]|nr:hypothetical protein [bacterium]
MDKASQFKTTRYGGLHVNVAVEQEGTHIDRALKELNFCKKYEREVNNDNTIRFNGEIIQLPPSKYKISYAKCKVEVCLLEDDRIYILYQNKVIHITKMSKNKSHKEIEEFLSKRGYVPYGVKF